MSHETYPARMSDHDAVLWGIEDDPLFRSTVMSISLFDRVPDRARLLEATDRMTRAVPRFRQRVVPDPLGLAAPHWEVDPHVDLAYHVRWARLSGDGSVDDLLAMAEPLAMQAFDRARPLWEWTIVEGLEGGRAALLAKVHHAITDGVGGVEMALNLFDLQRDAAERGMPPLPSGEAARWYDGAGHEVRRALGLTSTMARRGARTLAALVRDPQGSLRAVRDSVGSVGRMMSGGGPLSDIMTERSLSVRYGAVELPLQAFKDAARASGGKVNDIFLAGIASGIGAYHREHGAAASALRVAVMVSTRTESSAPGGNAFSPVRVMLPLGDADAEGVRTIRELVLREIAEPAVPLGHSLTGVVRRAPGGLLPWLVGPMQRSIDVLSSNVSGWTMPVYLAGACVDRVIPFAAPVGAAMNITIMSHMSSMNVGVTLDPAAVPDREVFMACLQRGFEQVLSLGREAVTQEAVIRQPVISQPVSRRPRTTSMKALKEPART